MSSRREFLKQTSFLAGGAGLWTTLPQSIQKALAINPDPGTTWENAEHIVLLMQENRSFDHCFGTLQGVRGFNDPRAISIPERFPVWAQPNEKGDRYVPFRLNMKESKVTWIGGLPHSWDNQVDARNNGRYDKWLDAKRKGGAYLDMPFTLGYYIREDIPFYYALADAFTVCDQNFCSSLTGTTANRSFHWSGTIRQDADSIACVRNSDTYYNNEAHWKTYPERLEENGISWKVYQNELSLTTDLEGEDRSWLGNFTNNNLEWFSNYNVRFHRASYDYLVRRIGELPAEIEQLKKDLKGKKQNDAVPIQKELTNKENQLTSYQALTKRWTPENFDKLTDFQKNIHRKAFDTNVNDPYYHQTTPLTYEQFGEEREVRIPKGDIFYNFRKDVMENTLPTVSWLVAPQAFSDHPSAPWFGAWYVSEALDILTSNPEIWKKTIFILNYDENDGYFDHIPPFVPPKQGDANSGKTSADLDTTLDYVTMEEERRRGGNGDDFRESPIGLGYRVPLIVASPWTRGGWVNSQVFDITSTLQFLEVFLEKKFGKKIKETNITDWRRTITGDLTSVFRKYRGEAIRMPEFLDREKFIKEIYNAKFKEAPTGYRPMTASELETIKTKRTAEILPGQEKGIRPSCAIPYELYVDGALDENKDKFKISFHAGDQLFGERTPGVPFNVYTSGKFLLNGKTEDVNSWAFAVRAGDTIDYEWPLEHFDQNQYDLKVYGPNGYFRSFAGNQDDPDIAIALDYQNNGKGRLTGIVVVRLQNNSDESRTVVIKDNAYGKGARELQLAPGANSEVVFDLKGSYGWYDLSVAIAGNDIFTKQYAGRVETGDHSKTDPLMGGLA